MIAVIDTETARLDGAVYDIGIVILTRNGKKELARYEAITKEVYTNTKVMKGAFFYKKVPLFYEPNIRCERMIVKPWRQIAAEVTELLKAHNVSIIAAYNLAFDMRVIIETGKAFNGFLDLRPYKKLCLWRMACESLLQQKSFSHYANLHGWHTPSGNKKSNAEVAYKYAFMQPEFVESHTALDDAIIESRLYQRLKALKRKINYGTIPQPWRLVQA